jgi:hypothetical protein
MTEDGSGEKTGYSQDDIDALAYSYVLSHGYEGALEMFAALMANCGRDDVGPDDVVATLCWRILDAINDEAATISRILDRMILPLHNGAHRHPAAIAVLAPNPIDRHIGKRLRQRRSELGLSLTRLAVDLALTPDALALIEEGATRLDAVTLERAIKRLGIRPADFFQTGQPDEDVGGAAQSLTR